MAVSQLEHGVAVVTGAAGGIGSALCDSLAAAGMSVVLVGRDAARLEQVRLRLLAPERHRALLADLGDAASVSALVQRCLALPRLDVLVHSAGVHLATPFESTSAAELDATWATNVRAPFLLTAGLLPLLRAHRGQIVFVNSSASSHPARPDVAAYAASKAALRAVADSVRGLVNPDGVRVLSVYPGSTATPMQAERLAREGRAYRPELLLQPADVAASVRSALELPRTAEVTDIHVRPLHKS